MQDTAVLVYPEHLLSPEDLLTFVEVEDANGDGFLEDWTSFGLNDDDLLDLQVCIMGAPQAAPVIEATDGLRQGEFSPESWPRDDRIFVRYVFFEEFSVVLLTEALSEDVPLDEEEKAAVRADIEHQRWLFATRQQ